jgi:signal transduction histidine kinase
LGLSIAYNIVTAMLGGRIEVTSELGKGTTFTIEIPLTASVEPAVNLAN